MELARLCCVLPGGSGATPRAGTAAGAGVAGSGGFGSPMPAAAARPPLPPTYNSAALQPAVAAAGAAPNYHQLLSSISMGSGAAGLASLLSGGGGLGSHSAVGGGLSPTVTLSTSQLMSLLQPQPSLDAALLGLLGTGYVNSAAGGGNPAAPAAATTQQQQQQQQQVLPLAVGEASNGGSGAGPTGGPSVTVGGGSLPSAGTPPSAPAASEAGATATAPPASSPAVTAAAPATAAATAAPSVSGGGGGGVGQLSLEQLQMLSGALSPRQLSAFMALNPQVGLRVSRECEDSYLCRDARGQGIADWVKGNSHLP